MSVPTIAQGKPVVIVPREYVEDEWRPLDDDE